MDCKLEPGEGDGSIFAALIEARPYRPEMSRQDAYTFLCDMDGNLELSLVKAFRNVALVG